MMMECSLCAQTEQKQHAIMLLSKHELGTWPGLGTGNLCNLKELALYLCVVSFSRFLGKLMIIMASNGHFCKHASLVQG